MTTLTQEQKRIKIAEACGIKVEPCTCSKEPWRDAESKKHLPDYFNDLNACHEMEKAIPTDKRQDYFIKLIALDATTHAGWDCAHATATQRAESFGLALNLWPR